MGRPQPGRSGLVLLVCLVVGLAEAAPVPDPPAEALDAELLDFLDSWQDEEGRWIDPFTVTNNPAPQAPAEPTPNRNGSPADARKPGREAPSMPAQDHPRDPLRMQTGP